MKNIIFINQNSYNESLAAKQLAMLLENTAYIDDQWCCCSLPEDKNPDISYYIKMDNEVYMINNYLLSKLYDNIVINCNNSSVEQLLAIIEHLDQSDYNLSIFTLTNTEGVDVEIDTELMNREYECIYEKLSNGQLIKHSHFDTTGCSAFKIGKLIGDIINK